MPRIMYGAPWLPEFQEESKKAGPCTACWVLEQIKTGREMHSRWKTIQHSKHCRRVELTGAQRARLSIKVRSIPR